MDIEDYKAETKRQEALATYYAMPAKFERFCKRLIKSADKMERLADKCREKRSISVEEFFAFERVVLRDFSAVQRFSSSLFGAYMKLGKLLLLTTAATPDNKGD